MRNQTVPDTITTEAGKKAYLENPRRLETEQGKISYAYWIEDVEKLVEDLTDLLQAHGGAIKVTEITDLYPSHDREAVREAMWKLIERKKAYLNPQRQIQLYT